MYEIAIFSALVSLIVSIYYVRHAYHRHSSSDALLSVFGLMTAIYCTNLYTWLNLTPGTPLQTSLRALDYIIAIPLMLVGLQMLQKSAEARERRINRLARPITYGTIGLLLPIITCLYLLIDQEIARRFAVSLGTPILGGLLVYYFNHLRNNPYRIPKPEFERGTFLINLGYLTLVISTGLFAGVLRMIDVGIVSILVAILLVASGGIVMGTITFAGLYEKLDLIVFIVDHKGDIEIAKMTGDLGDVQNHRIATTIVPYINTALEGVLNRCEEVMIPSIELAPLSSNHLYQIHLIPHELDSDGMPLSALVIINDITKSVETYETEQISELLYKFVRERDSAEFYLDLLSHDMSNIIQGILLGAEIALSDITNQEILASSLEIINEEVERSMILLRETKLMVHARDTEPSLASIDVLTLLEQVIQNIGSEYPDSGVKFTVRTAGRRFLILAEPMLGHGFHSILRYLIERQRLTQITIEILIHSYSSDTMPLRIEITDEGQSLTNKEKLKLLHWQTRLPSGGIGLPLANALINRYNGKIRIEDNDHSQTGTGLKFTIEFSKA
ncbi:MAG: hypothetical protein RTU92_10655 [Candidatus Thorarchaeota archaeon]